MRKSPLLGSVLALAVVLSACGGGGGAGTGAPGPTPPVDEGAPTPGGRLTLMISNDPSLVDPLRLVTPTDRQIASQVYEPLVELNREGELVPALALSWDSTDARTWTVKLREGVSFTDGTPFDAAAVIANVDRARTNQVCPSCVASLAFIDTVTEVDPTTVQFTLKAPLSAFPAYLNDTYFNMASPAVIAQSPDDVSKNPVGTGPFTLTRRDAQGFVFDKNPNYWNAPKPYLDGIDYRIIPDTQAAVAALQAGDVDALTNTGDTANTQAATDPRLRVIRVPGLGTNHIFMNNQQVPFNDPKARLALALATDRDALLALSHPTGEFEKVDGPWPSGMPITGAAVSTNYPGFDKARAQQLVQELGGLRFTMQTYNVGLYPQQAQALQSMWRDAGIEVELMLSDASTVVADASAQRPQVLLSAWSGRPDPDLNAFRYLHSTARSPAAVNDPELDTLLEQGRSTVDPAQRKEIYQQLVDRINETVPIIYFDGLGKSVIIDSERVGGATPPPDGNIRPAELWAHEG
jgi:ABC-type transport system substrate-binding protein